MIKKFIDKLLSHGLLFATMFVQLMVTILVVSIFLIIGVSVDWLRKHL